MTPRKLLLAAAAALALGLPGAARAADVVPAAPAFGPVQQAGFCPSCGHGVGSFVSGVGTCKSCGKHGCCPPRPKHHRCEPYVVNLCPGACFGYFQTQWRKWDEVCPYPYQGTGVADASRPPAPYLPSAADKLPPKKSDAPVLPDPRPVDPKTGLPMIPGVPEKGK